MNVILAWGGAVVHVCRLAFYFVFFREYLWYVPSGTDPTCDTDSNTNFVCDCVGKMHDAAAKKM